jgi:hypothetical protein
MINRLSAPSVIALGGLFLLVNAGTASQAAAQTSTYIAPRTADGKPDLQGMWTNNTITPMERPARFEGKPALTAEEQRVWEQQIADRTAEADLPSDPNRTAPTKDQIDLEDSYNNFWFDDGTTVAVYNGEPRTSLVVDPPDGRTPAPTAAARARMEIAAEERRLRPSDGPESRSLSERCLLSFGSSSGPPMLPILYNNYYQIVQSPGYVMILVEMVHDARIIRIDDEPLPAALQPWLGDSIGRWENETLVVETHNFHPLQTYRGSADQFRTTERFTRVGPDTINYSFTVNDPDTFTSAWTAEIPMNRTDEKMYEFACHEGNYALPGILAGARVEERDAGANQ